LNTLLKNSKEVIMKLCWCRIILSAGVILFAWARVSWGNIALTVIGALLLILSISGKCCCDSKKGNK